MLTHLGLMLALSVLRRKNQALPMWTGRVEGAGPDLARRNHTWLAIVLLAAVLAFWTWQWQQSPNGLLAGSGSSLSFYHHRHDHDD